VYLECLAQWFSETGDGHHAFGKFMRRLDEQHARNRGEWKQFKQKWKHDLQGSGVFRSWLLDTDAGRNAIRRWQEASGHSLSTPWNHEAFWEWFFDDQQACDEWFGHEYDRTIDEARSLLFRVRVERLLGELDQR
jgi:hypothetical protein